MSLAHDARVPVRPATAVQRSKLRGWPEIDNPAAWAVAAILLIMPLIANGFFLIEIFATTLILGTMALSLMFLAGYGGMVSLMQLTIAGFSAYMVAVFGVSGNANISLGWPWGGGLRSQWRSRSRPYSARSAARWRCAPRASTPS
ncbi:hypothetical protein ACVWZV_007340 [Bradyrhizobium sp. GM5.1]